MTIDLRVGSSRALAHAAGNAYGVVYVDGHVLVALRFGVTATGLVFGPPGYEINVLYIAALIALAVGGPGPLSMDGWWSRRRLRIAEHPEDVPS